MAGLELSSTVSTREAYDAGAADAPNRVALVDFGIKLNSIRWLLERDCLVRVFPMRTPVNEMMNWKPDGFLLSNGPGDPGAMPDAVELVREVVATGLPVFVVDREQAEKHPDMEVTHLHLNDGSVAGTRLKGKPVFSVQHHPEAGPGPLDSQYLFDDFVGLMTEKHKKDQVNVQHA